MFKMFLESCCKDRAGSSSYDNSPSSSCLHGRSWATWRLATVHVVEVAEEEVHLANVTLVKDIEYETACQSEGDLAQVVEPCLPR